ncbi:MAG: hypothetical protein IKI43_01555, partial [Campylobacter sp.]|nr:hypothetical protein [Campylobacter sp.]
MNKIFKLKKGSHGLKVVSEIAKSHSGEKAISGGGFGSAFFARLGLGGSTSHGSFSFGKVAMSLATIVAISAPFMPSEAEALVLCSANNSVTSGNAVGTQVTLNKGTLILTDTCPSGYTEVTTDPIAFNLGTASGDRAIAWSRGTA